MLGGQVEVTATYCCLPIQGAQDVEPAGAQEGHVTQVDDEMWRAVELLPARSTSNAADVMSTAR